MHSHCSIKFRQIIPRILLTLSSISFLQLIRVRSAWPARVLPESAFIMGISGCNSNLSLSFSFNAFGIWFGINSLYNVVFTPLKMFETNLSNCFAFATCENVRKLACNILSTSISSRDGLYWPSPERPFSPLPLISIASPPDQRYLGC